MSRSFKNFWRPETATLIAGVFWAGAAFAQTSATAGIDAPAAPPETLTTSPGEVFTYFMFMLGPMKLLAPYLKIAEGMDTPTSRKAGGERVRDRMSCRARRSSHRTKHPGKMGNLTRRATPHRRSGVACGCIAGGPVAVFSMSHLYLFIHPCDSSYSRNRSIH